MLKIRLQRVGRKHEPTFRLVLSDSKNGPKSGKTLETLGAYDSRRGEKAEFKNDRIKHWISVGAQLSGTVHNLLISRKIIEGKKVNVLPKKKPIAKEASEAPAGAPVVTATSEAVVAPASAEVVAPSADVTAPVSTEPAPAPAPTPDAEATPEATPAIEVAPTPEPKVKAETPAEAPQA
ncbi:30S ribosomal protein S16 [Candidatus Parcubacteria bacterium]|nr:30S ribosomal protein S16 [Candidatus Parcubacteria bacterium]